MSDWTDNRDFENFHWEEWWRKASEDPWRLFAGSIEPIGTEIWNFLLGRDDEPINNVFGGPMGGGWAGLSESGGEYQRARDEEGINTDVAGGIHNGIEAIVGSQVGGALGGIGGGGSTPAADGFLGSGEGIGAVDTGAFGNGGLFGSGGGASSGVSGGSGGLGAEGGAAAGGMFSDMNAMDYLDMGQQLDGLMGGGQQQPINNSAHAQAVANEARKRQMSRGLL